MKLKEKESPFVETAVAGTPVGRMANPEEVADLVAFLCARTAACINGEVIRIDGGAAVNIGMDDFLRGFLYNKSSTIKGKRD